MKLALVAMVACSSASTTTSGGPGMTDAFLHPAFRNLRPGHATLADVRHQLPTAAITADSALGGSAFVRVEQAPAIVFELGKVSGSLASIEGAVVVTGLETEGPGLCEWLSAAVRSAVTARRCRDHSKIIDRWDMRLYCLRDGTHEIRIQCRSDGKGPDVLAYHFVP